MKALLLAFFFPGVSAERKQVGLFCSFCFMQAFVRNQMSVSKWMAVRVKEPAAGVPQECQG